MNDSTLAPSMSGVRAARKRAGLTQVQVAELLDVPLDTYRRWDRGVTRPREPEQLQHLAEVLGATLDELYPPDNNPHVHAARARRGQLPPAPQARPIAVRESAALDLPERRPEPSVERVTIPDPREVLATLHASGRPRRAPRIVAAAALVAVLIVTGGIVLAITSGSHRSAGDVNGSNAGPAKATAVDAVREPRPGASLPAVRKKPAAHRAASRTKQSPKHHHRARRHHAPTSSNPTTTTAVSSPPSSGSPTTGSGDASQRTTSASTPASSRASSGGSGCVISDFTPIC